MVRALLLKRPSPLAYPGGRPGYDPNHIALAGGQLRFSGVSASGNGFINVGGGGKGVITGAPTSVRDGLIGPAMKVTAANQVCNFAGCPQIADTTQTVAAIFRIDSLAGFNGIVATSNTNNKGLYIAQDTSNSILVGVAGGSNSGTTLNGITFAAGNDYFVAMSVNAAAGTTSGVAVNLRTGQTGYGIGFTGIVLAASDGTFSIGGTAGLGGGSTIAAGMASSSLLSVPQLLQWAQDPWSFWYPRTLDLTMMLMAGSAGGSTGAASGAGVATVTGIGASTFTGVGSSSGAGTATGIFSFTATATGSSAGSATVSGVGASIFAGVASTSGSGVATGVGASTFAGVGNAAGISSVTGIWNAPGAGAGSTSGTSTTTGVGASTFASIGASTATGNATGVGAWTFSAVGVTAGVSTTTGLSPSVTTAVGVSIGISTVTGIGPAAGGGRVWRWLEGYREAVQQPSHSEEIKKAAAVLSKMGGHARASSLTAKQRSNIASTASKARWK